METISLAPAIEDDNAIGHAGWRRCSRKTAPAPCISTMAHPTLIGYTAVTCFTQRRAALPRRFSKLLAHSACRVTLNSATGQRLVRQTGAQKHVSRDRQLQPFFCLVICSFCRFCCARIVTKGCLDFGDELASVRIIITIIMAMTHDHDHENDITMTAIIMIAINTNNSTNNRNI